jgi:homopolymeric O-antigen transport system ATP-binding protein
MGQDVVIAADGLSKRYTLHHEAQPRYLSLREVLSEKARDLLRAFSAHARRHGAHASDEEFWALRDVSFEVKRGDRVGIIGRNGAGKSTLLKILSRITEPTRGRVEIQGRVSSLLEVGTGFHPELTGRENIYLNGTILGMRTVEIRRKFDEIVAFAEVERFLDTPVKRYSSGMYVRLAFSVAAHLEPDILVVDEVLSVGDAQFQRKCLGKMQDVTSGGRTVLFVSHNMTTVTSLCNHCLLLERGTARAFGAAAEITRQYFGNSTGGGARLSYSRGEHRPGDSAARLVGARLVDQEGASVDFVRRNDAVGIEMTFEMLRDGLSPIPNFHVFTQGQYAFVSSPESNHRLATGVYRSVMWIPSRFLNEGIYSIGLALTTVNPIVVHFNAQDALHFSVVDSLDDPSRNDYTQAVPGILRPRLEWSVERSEEGVVS